MEGREGGREGGGPRVKRDLVRIHGFQRNSADDDTTLTRLISIV